MPIYEYKCNKCNKVFEHFQNISDDPLKTCVLCGKKNSVTKIISPSGFRLKGSGWYETDFKKKVEKKDAVKPTEKN
tara:strand:+ start:1483 stop:1710 length:228 start_codon:yes stop_codon:yes gene_type:complete